MGRMGKCEDAYLLLDGEGGGGGPTANTKSASNDKKAVNKSGDYDYRTKDTPIEDDHNAWKKDSSPVNGYNHWEPEDTVADDYSSLKTDTKKSDDYDYWTDDDPIEDDHNSWNEDNSPVNDYGHWEAEDTVADDYSSLKADTAKSNHYDHWTDDDPMPDSHNSWNEDNSPVNNYRRWEREDTVADDYSYWKHHHKKSYDKDYYWENYQKFQQEDTPANDFSIPEPDNKVSENYAIPAAENTASEDYSIPETPPIAQDKAIEDPIPDSSSQNDNLKTSNNQISDSSETADSNQSKPIISAEEGLPVVVDTKVENDSPVDTLSSHIEPTATKAPVENERQVDTVSNHIEPTQSQSPVENERQVDTVSNHIEINQSLSVENDRPVDTLSSHIEPTATKAPVENERQVDTIINHIEPTQSQSPVENERQVDTVSNHIEINQSLSVENDRPVDTLSSHIEPTATKAIVENDSPVDTLSSHIEPTATKAIVENDRPVDTLSSHIEPTATKAIVENDRPVDTLSSHIEPTATKAPVENERQVDTVSNHIEPSIVKKTVGNIQSVNTAIDAVEAKTNNSASLQNNSEKTDDITLESAAPRNNNLNSKSADSMSVLISESTKNTNTKKEEGIPTETIDKNKEIKSAANTENGASQKNEVKIAKQQIEPVTVSPSTKARDLLLSKRGHTDNVTLGEFSHTSRRDILENYKNKPASIIVDYDTQGRSVTLDNFKVDGMDISIKREHDGYGNKFDSVRTIETVRLANGQVVKCNIQDMVGANAKSKEFADEHKGRILPDGKYFFTAAGLTKQKDGTYNSACFQNTLRLQTRDANIPEHIRNDINSKYFLFHATEYKEGYIPKKGKRIWINPWSAGCISSITGGQATHDDFMNMLTGITPENISITITSKKHVNI